MIGLIIKNKILVIIFAILLIILLIFLFSRRSTGSLFESEDDFLVKVTQEGKELTIYKNNRVEFRSENGLVYSEDWEEEKINELLLYLQYQDTELEGNTNVFYANGDTNSIDGSEIIDLIEDDITGGGGQTNPTSTPGSGGSSGGSGGGGNPTTAPWQRPPGCTYWRLNYCADRPATPTPISSAPPGIEVPYEFDCELGGSMVSGRTIISNTLCINTPTPSPSPN